MTLIQLYRPPSQLYLKKANLLSKHPSKTRRKTAVQVVNRPDKMVAEASKASKLIHKSKEIKGNETHGQD